MNTSLLINTKLKDDILQFITTDNIKGLKFWLLDLPLSDKIIAMNYIVELGQDAVLNKFQGSEYITLQNFRQHAVSIGKMYLDEKQLFQKLEKLREKYRLGTLDSMHIFSEKKMYMFYLSQTTKPYANDLKLLISKYMNFEIEHDLFDADSWIFED
jgi:hypothetical protein